MIRTVEAVIDPQGNVRLLKDDKLPAPRTRHDPAWTATRARGSSSPGNVPRFRAEAAERAFWEAYDTTGRRSRGRPRGSPGAPARVPTIHDSVAQRAWLRGPPSHVIGIIREFEA